MDSPPSPEYKLARSVKAQSSRAEGQESPRLPRGYVRRQSPTGDADFSIRMQHAGAITGAAGPESLILIIINILFEKGPGSAVL